MFSDLRSQIVFRFHVIHLIKHLILPQDFKVWLDIKYSIHIPISPYTNNLRTS